MSVPDNIRLELRDALWKVADTLDWLSMPQVNKTKHYEAWTRDPKIGGLIARFIPLSDVRVYLKDSLLKHYAQHRLADEAMPCRVLGISPELEIAQTFVKPHGRCLRDGRVICWGQASSWKALLMATFERAYTPTGRRPFAAILTHAVGRYKEPKLRQMVETAAKKLQIERVVWIEH
ncbi:MAG: hypothetical protein QOE70_5419 [Chthoniobacter sp.]|jgi:hypothetical protein|nr:hypothetical protein [Chthoniobacter sp.]